MKRWSEEYGSVQSVDEAPGHAAGESDSDKRDDNHSVSHDNPNSPSHASESPRIGRTESKSATEGHTDGAPAHNTPATTRRYDGGLDTQGDAKRGSELDADGYRRNVGIIVCNRRKQVLWARRIRRDGWQFPQGGIEASETVEQAVFRELNEEVGLSQDHVRVIGRTQQWLRYDLPERLRRFGSGSDFRGQKQIWFLFELIKHDSHVSLSGSPQPEFDAWRWVDYWRPLDEIVVFKKDVYRQALTELEPLLVKIGKITPVK